MSSGKPHSYLSRDMVARCQRDTRKNKPRQRIPVADKVQRRQRDGRRRRRSSQSDNDKAAFAAASIDSTIRNLNLSFPALIGTSRRCYSVAPYNHIDIGETCCSFCSPSSSVASNYSVICPGVARLGGVVDQRKQWRATGSCLSVDATDNARARERLVGEWLDIADCGLLPNVLRATMLTSPSSLRDVVRRVGEYPFVVATAVAECVAMYNDRVVCRNGTGGAVKPSEPNIALTRFGDSEPFVKLCVYSFHPAHICQALVEHLFEAQLSPNDQLLAVTLDRVALSRAVALKAGALSASSPLSGEPEAYVCVVELYFWLAYGWKNKGGVGGGGDQDDLLRGSGADSGVGGGVLALDSAEAIALEAFAKVKRRFGKELDLRYALFDHVGADRWVHRVIARQLVSGRLPAPVGSLSSPPANAVWS